MLETSLIRNLVSEKKKKKGHMHLENPKSKLLHAVSSVSMAVRPFVKLECKKHNIKVTEGD